MREKTVPVHRRRDLTLIQRAYVEALGASCVLVKVVFVDVGGTLWPDVWPELARDREERILRLRMRVPTVSESQAAGLVVALSRLDHPASQRQQTKRLVADALRHLGLEQDVSVETAIDSMCLPAVGRVEPFLGARDLLASLARRTQVIIVSNVMWRGSDKQRQDFARFGLAEYVKAFVTSLDVGWRKPHPHFFDAALAVGGVPADQCVTVGNSESNDIEPAVARGMTTVRLAIEEPCPTSSSADHVCTTLDQVTQALFGGLMG